MENISMNQALAIWSELWRAYYLDNGYGSDTTKIYAYQVMPHSPAPAKPMSFEEAKKATGIQAARSLYSLLKKFSRENDCTIMISHQELGRWFTWIPFTLHESRDIRVIRKRKRIKGGDRPLERS